MSVGGGLGDAANAVFVAQQMDGSLIKNLPGEQARLLEYFASILGIGMAVKIRAFIDVTITVGINDDAIGVVVLLEVVADGKVAERRSGDVPGH